MVSAVIVPLTVVGVVPVVNVHAFAGETVSATPEKSLATAGSIVAVYVVWADKGLEGVNVYFVARIPAVLGVTTPATGPVGPFNVKAAATVSAFISLLNVNVIGTEGSWPETGVVLITDGGIDSPFLSMTDRDVISRLALNPMSAPVTIGDPPITSLIRGSQPEGLVPRATPGSVVVLKPVVASGAGPTGMEVPKTTSLLAGSEPTPEMFCPNINPVGPALLIASSKPDASQMNDDGIPTQSGQIGISINILPSNRFPASQPNAGLLLTHVPFPMGWNERSLTSMGGNPTSTSGSNGSIDTAPAPLIVS